MLLALGVTIVVAAGVWLAWLGLRRPPHGFARPFPAYGTIAWLALALCEVLLALRVPSVTSFFTALAWTFYIAGVDALVYRKRGDSMLHHPAAFTAMALLSIPSWLIFEAYNLWLRNWVYVGVPPGFWDFAMGACWAFATITPGILETADLILAGTAEHWRCAPWRLRAPKAVAIGGAICLILPLLLPRAA
ncbi:MAG TPA: hypothetical protein VN515_05875, partial [Terriglobales bacterium]|nr:hypothetical protein [Terriglobales bacterium]